MNIICAYCGAGEAIAPAKRQPAGDLYECPACAKISVFSDTGLRQSSQAERAEASNDWRKARTGLPTMIGFDARG